MSDPADMTAVEKPPFFNRSRLLKVIGISAACFAVLGLLVNYGGSNKGKRQAAAVETAPNVKVPDFGDYRNRAGDSPPAAEPDVPGVAYSPPPVQSRDAEGFSYREPPVTARGSAPPSPAPQRDGRKTPEETARESSLVPVVQGAFVPVSVASLPQETAVSSNYLPYIMPSTPPPAASQGDSFGDILKNAFSSSSGNVSSYDSQNMQGNKQGFYPGNSSAGNTQTVTGSFLRENTLWNGTIIPAVLITGINTDLPGDVQARVTQNVYDSQTGKLLLVPQGTILIASYNSSVSFAQSRVQIVWNTLIRPDGFTLNLGGMNAVDSEGYSGTKGWYSENIFQYAKAMGVISLFSVLNGYVSQTIDAANNPVYQDMIIANQNVINQLGTKIIDRALDIQPTITVKNGTSINVMLNKHLQLPPVDDYAVTAKYVRR